MIKKKWIIIISFSILAIIGLIVGSFYDYQINDTIFLKNNIFSVIFASFSEIVGYGAGVFFGGVLLSVGLNQSKGKKIFSIILSIAGSIGGTYQYATSIVNINGLGSLNGELLNNYLIGLPFSLIFMSTLFYYGFKYGKKNKDPELFKFTIIMIIYILITIVAPNLLKPISHRPRFRWLIETNPDLYHNWWEPFKNYMDYVKNDGFNLKEQFKSFPSSHTCTALITLGWLYYLPNLNPKFKNKEPLLLICGACYGLIVAFSRMLCGAHFLSDISVGYMFGIVCFIIFNIVINKNIKWEKK